MNLAQFPSAFNSAVNNSYDGDQVDDVNADVVSKPLSRDRLDTRKFRFPQNLGDISDEYGERFHHAMSVMETSYLDPCNPNMMDDYFWFLQRVTTEIHKRKSKYLKTLLNSELCIDSSLRN